MNDKKVLYIGGSIVGLLIVGAFIFTMGSSSKNVAPAASSDQQASKETDKDQSIKNSEKALVRASIDRVTINDTSAGSPGIRKTEINENKDGKYDVTVEFNTEGYTSVEVMKLTSSQLYRELYATDNGVRNATVTAYREYDTDSYGHKSTKKILTTIFNFDEASKVNFETKNTSEIEQVITDHWTVVFVDPEA